MMSVLKWKSQRDLCRCCHTEGLHESIYTSRNWMGTEEVVYADMLRECFDIELSKVRVPWEKQLCTICGVCIEKLSQALQFKRQVRKCETRLREMILTQVYTEVLVEVKEELPEPEENDEEKPPIDCQNIEVKLDKDSKASDDETMAFDETTGDYDDDRGLENFKTEDSEDAQVPMRKSGRKKNVTNSTTAQAQSGKRATSSVKLLKKKKKSEKKPTPRKEKKTESTTEGVVKLVKQAKVKEDVDYKQVGDMVICCRCGKNSNTRQVIIKHFKQVHLKKPRYYTCPECPKKFTNKSPLTLHKLEEHNIDDRLKCTACDKTFNTKTSLKKHVDSFHMLGVKYKCPECDYVCFHSQYLRRHMQKHKTVKEFHCKYCHKSFVRRNTLNFHERIHTGDKRKVCKVCGEAFVQKASLNYHMGKYHPGVDF